jgi:hypothetical protein
MADRVVCAGSALVVTESSLAVPDDPLGDRFATDVLPSFDHAYCRGGAPPSSRRCRPALHSSKDVPEAIRGLVEYPPILF